MMLDANNYHRRAAFYEIEYTEDNDFEFWRSFITRPDFRIMDVPCGVGVRAIYLARHGARVTGVDREPAMVEKFKERLVTADERLGAQAVVGDMRTLRLGDRFDLVFCAREAFQFMLYDSDVVTALRSLASHLVDGGRLLIDLADFPRCVRGSDYYLGYYDPDIQDGIWVVDWSRVADDQHIYTRWHRQAHIGAGLLEIEFNYEKRLGEERLGKWQELMRFRRITRNEFLRLARDAGLQCTTIYGNYEGKCYEEGDPRIIFELTF